MNHKAEILIELFKRGDYSQLGLFDKQLQAMEFLQDNTVNECLYGGGARGGKSVLGCRWHILRRMAYKGSSGLIARSEYSKLVDTTFVSFKKELDYIGLEDGIDYKIKGNPYTVHWVGGGTTFFREIKYIPTDPEFDRLGSYDLTDAFIDEAQQVHYKATSVLKGRFSEVEGDGWKTIPKTLYTCNPAKTWVNGDFVKPHKEGILPDRKKFVPALPSDNPHVPQSFFDNLSTADETTRQRLLFGNFDYDDDPRRLCEYDAICDAFTNEHVFGDSNNRHISADLAMKGRDKFIGTYWNGKIATISIDKDKAGGKEIETDLLRLKNEYRIGNSKIIADSDGLGNYLESYINGITEFHGNARPIDIKEFDNNKIFSKTFGNLKDQCGFKLAELINKREIKIICTKVQEELIKNELSTCLKEQSNNIEKRKLISKDEMKASLGSKSPDYFDSLLMGMLPFIKPSDVIVINYG